MPNASLSARLVPLLSGVTTRTTCTVRPRMDVSHRLDVHLLHCRGSPRYGLCTMLKRAPVSRTAVVIEAA